ncbi:unnamed protein product [Closterium sp. NIES-53]
MVSEQRATLQHSTPPLAAREPPLQPAHCPCSVARRPCSPARRLCSPVRRPCSPRAASAARAPPTCGPPAAPAARAPPLCGPPAAPAARWLPPCGQLASPVARSPPTLRPTCRPLQPASRPSCSLRATTCSPLTTPLLCLRIALLVARHPALPAMASLRVLTFDHEGRPIQFDTWLDDLQLYILSNSRDSVSLFDHTSGASLAPPTTADSATRSLCPTRHKIAKALYDAVVARYSSPATASLGRLILPYLFPELSAFATVEDLVSHLRTSDARYRAANPAKFLDRNPPPMNITLYFLVTRLPDSLRAVTDHFLALDPTDLTIDLLERHLLAAETSAIAVGAARGTPRTPFFEGCSPSPLAPSYASAAAVDVFGAKDVGAASASGKRRSSKGKDGRSGGGGSRVVGAVVEVVEVEEVVSAVGVVAGVGALVAAAGVVAVEVELFRLEVWRWPAAAAAASERDPFTPAASTAALQDAMVTTTTPGGQRVSICTCTRTGRHLATFNLRPGSSVYTLATEPPQVAASAQVSASGSVAPPCSYRLLSHQTLLWHHRLGHPSLPCLRGMHSRLLVSGLPRSLPPLLPSPAPPCLPCVKGRHGQDRERYFLLVVDDYTRYITVFTLRSKGKVPDVLIPWICAVRLQLRERFCTDLHVLRVHSDRGGEFSSDLLRDFCRGEGILQSFTLPGSPQQNGIVERRIGLFMEVARTSMIHAAAPHFLWRFAVRYATHQLNLWPCVSLPETSPTLRWTGKVGDASVFRVWVLPVPAPSPPDMTLTGRCEGEDCGVTCDTPDGAGSEGGGGGGLPGRLRGAQG